MLFNLMTLIFLILVLFIIKKMGFGNYGKKIIVRNYLDVSLSEENKIFIKIKKKLFHLIEREKTYEIKYIRGKNNIGEIKEYFEVALKDQDFIIKEINSSKFFDFQKKAIILLRNPISVLNKIPINFLPETELKSLIYEMAEFEIVEIEKSDFKTFFEKMLYLKFKKLGEKYEEKNYWFYFVDGR